MRRRTHRRNARRLRVRKAAVDTAHSPCGSSAFRRIFFCNDTVVVNIDYHVFGNGQSGRNIFSVVACYLDGAVLCFIFGGRYHKGVERTAATAAVSRKRAVVFCERVVGAG